MVNPALGRIDYTPYAQGAVAGAQGIAQGIAGFGQGVSQGIREFLKKKEEKELEKQGISVEVVDPRTLRPLDKGTILHYDGAAWSPMQSGTINMLSEQEPDIQRLFRESIVVDSTRLRPPHLRFYSQKA